MATDCALADRGLQQLKSRRLWRYGASLLESLFTRLISETRPMRLYLVQHGDALAKEIDPDRPLSERGRQAILRLAEFLHGSGMRPDRILHSGKTRARQTAELLASMLPPEGELAAASGLAPNDSAAAFLATLEDQSGVVIIASHLPFVARVVSQALTGEPDWPLVAFVPGTVAGLQRDDSGNWSLFMVAQPGGEG